MFGYVNDITTPTTSKNEPERKNENKKNRKTFSSV